MTYSEQLERETEQTRAAFERTLEELRARITPGQVVDQLVEYARGGTAATFLRNLGQRTVDNPLPLLLIGAGLAWLVCANGRGTQHSAGPSAGAIAGAARSAASAIADFAERARSRLGDDGSEPQLGQSEAHRSSLGDFVQRAKARIGGNPSEPQLGQSEAHRSGFADVFREHPVVLVGLGLAIGAAIGAAITPPGRRSREEDAAKERLGHMGEEAQAGSRPHQEDVAKERMGNMGEAAASGSRAQAQDGSVREQSGRTNGSDGSPRAQGTTAL